MGFLPLLLLEIWHVLQGRVCFGSIVETIFAFGEIEIRMILGFKLRGGK